MDDCHPRGRLIAAPIAREMYRALGFEVCPTCHRVIAIRWRQQRFAPEAATARSGRANPGRLARTRLS